ncbi:TonB-dependent receptor [Segetibacter sp.]|uniref:TonB-dependent receptor n=1 Tax=Segetibacter sp. TaxID=2231182 RepID=UPI0026258F7E|nr:TonB-dependent receptor [Segetibacter sp.]MCW3079747.1 putative tonB-linked outer rane receptor [Segetibacter sp.]
MNAFLVYPLQVLMLLTLTLQLSAQGQTIIGTVKDGVTKQPVPGCSISLLNTRTGTVGNNEGKFRIKIPAGLISPRLVITSLGYTGETIQVLVEKTNYEIELKPALGAMNEVVVTGVSKATLVRENPVSVSVVSARQIEQATESNIIDVFVKNVPGLNAVKTGPNISKPFIRGLGYNRVLTLYDGIRQEGQQWGDEHGIEVDTYNIEKGEVIRGPASLIYGSDALAGVVSLLPAMPVNTEGKLKGKYFSEYQSNNGLIGNGLRLISGSRKVSFALRGSYRVAKNYKNSIDGSVYNTGFREANASGSIKYTGDEGYSVLNFTVYNNRQGIPDGSRDSVTRKFTKQMYEGSADDVTTRPFVTHHEQNSYHLSPLHQHLQHYRIYTNNHFRFLRGDVDFLLALQQNVRIEFNHPSAPKQAGMYVRLNTFNYGFNYNAPTLFNTDFTFGLNGMYQGNKNKNATDFPIPDYNLFDIGSYVHAKWKKDNWTVSGGFRYDRRVLRGNNFYTNTNSVTGFDRRVFLPDTVGAYLQFPSFTKIFSGSSMSLGVTYQLTEQFSLKANVARGYRSPSITEFASNGLDPGAHIIYLGNRDFVPEFSLQEDVGAEAHFKNFLATASIFNNNIQNYIYLTQVTDASGNPLTDAQGNKTYQYQQSSAQLYGFEATINIQPSILKGLSFDNAFSITYGYNKQSNFKGKGVNGEYLPLIPPLKIISSISQILKPKSKTIEAINLKVEAEVSGSQNRFLALNNSETATAGFALLNISVNTQIKYSENQLLQLQFQINNLFDKAYQSNLSRLKYFEYYTSSANGKFGIFNMGRNICLKLIMPF